MSYLDKIFDARENSISDSSRKLYTRNLKALHGDGEITSLDFLNDVESICKKISHLSDNTKKSYIISICTVLKNSNKQDLYDLYFSLLKDFNSKLSVNISKSDKQEQNWLNQDQVLQLREKLGREVPSKIEISSHYDKLLNYLLLSLYTMLPPRRNIDYSMMFISNDMTNTNHNYLDIKNKQFIFNNYKTAGKYKTIKIDIPDDLFNVIKKYLKNHHFKSKLKNKKYEFPFLLTALGTEFTSDGITKRLSKIFGKKIGSSMLRNIFLSSKYSDVINDLKDDAADMGTSVNTALNNYIKTDE